MNRPSVRLESAEAKRTDKIRRHATDPPTGGNASPSSKRLDFQAIVSPFAPTNGSMTSYNYRNQN